MKAYLLILLSPVLLGLASADVARQQTLMHYNRLLGNSPFTLPPIVEPNKGQEVEQASAFEDWNLSGILPLGDSYFVTLRHKKEKERSEMMRGIGERSESGFELLQVQTNADPTKTRVQIKSGARTEWLSFDLAALGVPEPQAMVSPSKGGKKPSGNQKLPPGVKGKDPQQPARALRSRTNR